jgi:putative (di)nucleoside polyphosphate hydrolase
MKFLGNDREINIKTKYPEFLEWKWIETMALPNIVVNFKVDMYKKISEELKSLNFN